MALILKDRVKQTAAAPGTGTITLSGSVSGFQSFASVGNGNTTYFAIVDPISGDWEVSLGTYTSSGTTLTRTTVLSSSNAGSLVNFTGAVDVFVTYPSEKAVYEDASNVVNATSFGAITATSAALTTGTVSTTPASNTDIANKQYVDGLVTQGISYHEPVFVESPNTTGNLNATYNNGSSGVGATLTNAGTQVALTVDGVLMTVGKRVLVYNQTNQAENGVYTVTTVGTGSTNWVLTRAADANTYGLRDPNALGYNDAFFVTNGDTGAGETYVCTTTGTITFGTTAITFAQISSAQVYNAGTGLNLSPATTFNISNTGVSANTYGSASAVPVFAVNAQGQLTSVTNTNIAINGSAVSGNITGSAGSVANALTLGTYLTGTSFNGSAAVTATVDATATNTASKVVARDSSGNFSAGTITATLSGSATSATAATNISGGAANQIPYNTALATTSFITAPTTAGTYLGWNGSAFAYSAISTPNSVTFNNGGSGDASGTSFNGATARTISYNTIGASPLAGSSSLTTTGTVTSGTWSGSFGAVSGANLTSLTAANISGQVAIANGGTAASTAGGARTNLGATTLGGNLFTITNPSAVTFPRFNADNTVSSLDAATFRSAIGAGTSSTTGTVTSVAAGSYLTGGTITTSGTLAVDATTTNTASKVVARDASGNFSAGTITATLSGNASTATSATTAGSITSQANSATITATSANTANQIVLRDASGNFSAGTITAALNGNATSANNATTAGGLAVNSTGVNNVANQIVRTQGDGYANFGWINTVSGSASGTPNRVYCSEDAYIRYYSMSTFTGYVQAAASGTWGINVSGNAATATTATNLSGGSVSATTVYGSSYVNTAGPYYRNVAGSGYLNGQYSSVETTSTSGAIYSIGGSYVPGTTNLGNMYGVGYTYSGYAAGNPGGVPSNTWGMYGASGGTARWFLDSDNGRGYFASNLYVNGGTQVVYNSGTWSINVTGSSGSCTGNAATATNASNTSSISNAVGGSYTWTAANYFQSNFNTGSGSGAPLQAYSSNGSGAVMSFHRAGYYAVNMGLDSDNVMRIGGWSASANRWQLDMSGNGTYAGSVTAYSDERLKKDWAPVQEDFVAKLAKVRSGTYTRIDNDERQAGVGAQSLEPLLPEVVLTSNDGTLSVAYGNAAMVSAVELAKDNVELRARIEKLEALVAKLIEG